jgi:hypothetical protein
MNIAYNSGSRSRSNSQTGHEIMNSYCRERTETENEESRKLIHHVIMHLVEINIAFGKPFCAAAHLVSIGDIESATCLLSLCGEYDTAYAVAKCFQMDTTPHLLHMAQKAEFLGDIDLAMNILLRVSSSSGSNRHIELLISR